jgi:hypothetical protein
MDGASVVRLMSLIPERGARTQSGTLFSVDGSVKMDLLRRFLHWLGPLECLTKEDQQLLGLRAGAKPLAEGDEGTEEEAQTDELDEAPVTLPGAGTQIAA